MLLTSNQVKMARVALGLTIDELSDKSGVSWALLQNIERKEDLLKKKLEVSDKLKFFFENEGIEFFEEESNFEAFIKKKKK